MFTSMEEVEEFDKFVDSLVTNQKNNTKDMDELVSKFNTINTITFCNFALNRDVLIALIKDKNDTYVPFAFKVKYSKGKFLGVYTSGKNTGFRNDNHEISELGAIITILHSIQNLEVSNTTLGLPDYYYHINK